jgi:hypothetical protein
VNALSQTAAGPLRVAIIGRSLAKTSRLALIANARAAMFRTPVQFQPLQIAQFKALAFSRAFRYLKPKVIFHAASLQSPWEAAEGQNSWTKLVESAGFGITLPLQMALATETANAASDGTTAIINASYPDCVNVALGRLGLRTTCGIGNSAIIEAFCRSHPNVKSGDVRVAGHHGHLSGWMKQRRSAAQPRVWVANREIDALRLTPNLGSVEEELNHVTASTALSVMLALLSGKKLQISIPGVGGLPGGYPFSLVDGKFALCLPTGISQDEAIVHNKTGEQADGLELDSSSVKFFGKAVERLVSVGFAYAQGFDLADWQKVCDQLLALRNRLRKKPVDR